MWSLVFGIFYGLFCGLTVFSIGENSRSKLEGCEGRVLNIFFGIVVGVAAGMIGFEGVREAGWGGVVTSMIIWFFCTLVFGGLAGL